MDSVLMQKRIEDSKDVDEGILKINNYIMVFSIGIAILTFIMVYNDVKDFVDKYIWIPLSINLLSIVIIFVLLIKSILNKPKKKNFDIVIQKKLEEFAELENKEFFEKKGFKLIIGDQFLWLNVKKIQFK